MCRDTSFPKAKKKKIYNNDSKVCTVEIALAFQAVFRVDLVEEGSGNVNDDMFYRLINFEIQDMMIILHHHNTVGNAV